MNDHTGGVTLKEGLLLLADPYCLGYNGVFTISGGEFDNATGGVLDIMDAIPQVWLNDFAFLGTDDLIFGNSPVNVIGKRDVVVEDSVLEIGGPVTAGAGFTKLGEGTLTLSSATNSMPGRITVAQGVLEVLGRTGDGPYDVQHGATLRLNHGTGGGYAATNIKLYGDGKDATTGLWLGGSMSYNASGVIEFLNGPTTIRHFGEGMAAIGMFDINSNGLNVSAAASGSEIDENIQLVSRGYGVSAIIQAGAETETGDLVVNGPLNAANGGLYKRGPGSVRLNGPATTGNLGVRILDGKVIAGADNVLGVNAILPISAPGTLVLNGYNQESSSLSGAGAVVNGGGQAAILTVGQAETGTFSGVLGGETADENNFGLVKRGPETLVLSSSNTYTGDTDLEEGMLVIGQPYLADGSTVRISSGAVLQLIHGQQDTVARLYLDGVQQASGVYDASNSGDLIIGAGSLLVTEGSDGESYADWAAVNAGGQGPDQDYDHDGVPNGVEYFMGVSGPGFTANPGVVDGKVTWPMNPAFTGSYEVQTSADLVNWAPAADVSVIPGVSVSYTLPRDGAVRFVRLQVSIP